MSSEEEKENEKKNESEKEKENEKENENENEEKERSQETVSFTSEWNGERPSNSIVECLGETNSNYDICFKIVIIGDSGVGKSCLAMRVTKNKFLEGQLSTVGFEYFTLYYRAKKENKILKFQIWDTCGQETYKSLSSNFYRNSCLTIIVYSISERETFNSIGTWYNQLKSYSSPEIKLVLVGNKCDLSDKRKVSFEEGEKVAKELGFNLFLETSARSGVNSHELFLKIVSLIYDDKDICNLSPTINRVDFSTVSESQSSQSHVLKNTFSSSKKDKKDKCCILF